MFAPVRNSFLALFAAASWAAAADPALVRLIMPDARVVSGIQVDQSKVSPFGRYLLSQFKEDQQFRDFVANTGFDPRQDVQEILIASTGVQQKGGPGLVLVRGRFDTARILVQAKQHGATATMYQGVDVITDGSEKWVAFPEPSLAVVGDQTNVKAALDRRSTGSSLDPLLAAKVSDMSSRNDAWFVSTLPLSTLRGLPTLTPPTGGTAAASPLQSIEEVSGGVKFGSAILVSGEAKARSEKDASALADVVRFLLAMAGSAQTPEAQRVTALLQTLDLSTQGNVLRYSLNVPEEQVETLIKQSQQVRVKKASRQK